MTITPNDINNKEFKKVLRGYDEDEVDEFLEEIVDDYEKNYRENINLKEKISSLEEKLKHYEDIELTLQNTLILAQSAAEQAKDSSKKDSELILKQAQDDASKMIYEAKETVLRINKEQEMLKHEYELFKSRFVGFLQAEIDTIDKCDLNKE